MKEVRRHIVVPRLEADKIIRLLATEHKDWSECMGKDETISYSANFGNGIKMNVKLCGVKYEEDGENRPWTEAVLFDQGYELCCSEAGDKYFGEWALDHEGIRYIAEVIAEPVTHTIWHNDACDMYDDVKDEMPDEDDEEIFEEIYRRIDQYMDDEVANLDKEAPGKLFLIGTLERWNGAYSTYRQLGTSNIGESLPKVISSFEGDNTIHIYEQDGHVYVSQTGHDNPVNPSVFELRAFAVDFDSLEDDKTDTLMSNSQPVGSIVAEVYGW